MAIKAPNLPEIFYDPEKTTYWRFVENARRYLKSSASDIKDFLKRRKIEGVDEHDKWALSLGDGILTDIRDKKFLDYAAPLAGHKAGYFETTAGLRVLVTIGIQLPSPNYKTKCPTLTKFVEMFFDDQADFLLMFLKARYESLAKGEMKPGQLCAIVGESGCGKGFFHKLVTELVGGRSADPFSVISGGTPFNGHLAKAEHLMMEDPTSSSDVRMRRKITNEIKKFVANSDMSVHDKGKIELSLPVSHVLTHSVNNERENMLSLPIMDLSMMDKVHLFKASNAQSVLSDDRLKNLEMLKRELPGFVAMLLELKIPKAFQCPRYGVCKGHTDKTTGKHICKGWHHPEILDVLLDMSEHEQLHSIIQEAFFERGDYGFWTGSAEGLKQDLSRLGHAHKIEKLLFHTSMVGTYLARLAEKFPDQYKSAKSNGKTKWTITQPKDKNAD